VPELQGLAVADQDDRFHDHYLRRLSASIGPATERIERACEPANAEQVRQCRAALLAQSEQQRRGMVRYPLFNYYWLEVTRAFARNDRQFVNEWSTHLARFVIGPQLRPEAVPATGWRLPTQAGGVVKLPSNRYDLRVDNVGGWVTLAFDEDGDGIVRDGQVALPLAFVLGHHGDRRGTVSLVRRANLATSSTVVDAGDAWTARLLTSINTRATSADYPAADLSPMDPLPSQVPDQLDRAIRLIGSVWPEAAGELNRYLRLIVPYVSSFHSSFTESCTMGAIYLSEAMWPFTSVFYTAEHILHEVSHLRLTLVQELEVLVEADADTAFRPPWRRDPRPLSGTIQGIFAFGRMAGFHRRAFAVTGDVAHRIRHAEVVRQLREAMRQIEDNQEVRLTPAGRDWWLGIAQEAGREVTR
jgi:HEXXH motif-containing protein